MQAVALLEQIFRNLHCIGFRTLVVEFGFLFLPFVHVIWNKFGSRRLFRAIRAVNSTFQGDSNIALPARLVVVPLLRELARTRCEIRILFGRVPVTHGGTADTARLLRSDLRRAGKLYLVQGNTGRPFVGQI